MRVEARMLGQPLLHGRVLMGGVVVGDQMPRLVLGRLAIDLAQELQPFDGGVLLLALADDLDVQHVERGKQHGCAVALVIVHQSARCNSSTTGLRLKLCKPIWDSVMGYGFQGQGQSSGPNRPYETIPVGVLMAR